MINIALVPKAYSEVYGFINALGEEYKNKVPASIFNTIANNRDLNFNPQYSSEQVVNETTFSKEALSLISAIYLQYWCTDSVEKKELQQIYVDNDKKEEQKYSYENLFTNNTQNVDKTEDKLKVNEKEVVSDDINKENLLIVENKEGIFSRIINFFKKLFKR